MIFNFIALPVWNPVEAIFSAEELINTDKANLQQSPAFDKENGLDDNRYQRYPGLALSLKYLNHFLEEVVV